jgi:hypothetical protein
MVNTNFFTIVLICQEVIITSGSGVDENGKGQ